MNKKTRFTKISIPIILIVATVITYFSFIFRVTENQVMVYQMEGFHEIKAGSERLIDHPDSIKQFTYAVRFADKQPGMVDIAAPPYQFILGEYHYYLWVSDNFRLGSLMKLPDTGTVYTISESRATKLLDILNEVYEQ